MYPMSTAVPPQKRVAMLEGTRLQETRSRAPAHARPLRAARSRTALLMASLGLLLSSMVGCASMRARETSAASSQGQRDGAFSLAPVRTPGDWRPPKDSAERTRLNAELQAHFPAFQDCMWRYTGASMVGSSNLYSGPLIAQLGVDSRGTIQWLELGKGAIEGGGLRECLSRELLQITFDPAPAHPTILVLTLTSLRLS